MGFRDALFSCEPLHSPPPISQPGAKPTGSGHDELQASTTPLTPEFVDAQDGSRQQMLRLPEGQILGAFLS